MRSHAIAWDRIRLHEIACNHMRSRKKTLCGQLSEFLKMHREREAGQKVCLKCFFTTTVNRFHYYFFRLSQKGRKEKRESFYTAKRVSSVHSRRDETRLAVFSVPFLQNKFRTCFFQKDGIAFQRRKTKHIGRIYYYMVRISVRMRRGGNILAKIFSLEI
jgi:hypothetical protein